MTIAVFLSVAIFASRSATVEAQLSPGPLASAHAELDGPLDCMKCHRRGDTGLEAQCLACHREIAATLDARRGLHGKATLSECGPCHPDHAGRDFDLIAWEEGGPEQFDHSKTTFTLAGKHDTLECRGCHNAKLSVSPIAKLSPRKDFSRGYVGLSLVCVGCHADPHEEALGDSCRQCHDENAWKPAAGFDHEKSAYSLTGKHEQTSCEACHRAERLERPIGADGKRTALWKPLAHNECSDCHEDPHRDQLGAECGGCHTTDGFDIVDRDGLDHDRTRYPLRGKHRSVECSSCHDEREAWGSRPPFERCDDCHADAHDGQARLAGEEVDCDACHDVEGFSPSTYTVARHARADYPLAGRHAETACGKCHGQPRGSASRWGSAAVVLRPRYGECTECHADPHRGRFTAEAEHAYAGGCEACHGLTAFRPSKFAIEDHDRTAFALRGAHRAVACVYCHEALEREPAASSLVRASGEPGAMTFEENSAECADCHTSPHAEQFDDREDRGACDGCHGIDAFIPTEGFDHQSSESFPLTGAHVGVACSQCHPDRADAQGVVRTVYRPLGRDCVDCHDATITAARRESN